MKSWTQDRYRPDGLGSQTGASDRTDTNSDMGQTEQTLVTLGHTDPTPTLGHTKHTQNQPGRVKHNLGMIWTRMARTNKLTQDPHRMFARKNYLEQQSFIMARENMSSMSTGSGAFEIIREISSHLRKTSRHGLLKFCLSS